MVWMCDEQTLKFRDITVVESPLHLLRDFSIPSHCFLRSTIVYRWVNLPAVGTTAMDFGC
jgi:hypothetical protein